MTAVTTRAYRFSTAAHWAAGTRTNLTLEGDRLRMPDTLCASRIPGTGPADGSAVLAADSCGRLLWLRTADRVVVRLHPFGLEEVGVLDGSGPVQQLAAGSATLWALADGGVERYSATDLQLFSRIPSPGWAAVAVAADGRDGLWVLEVPVAAATNRHEPAGRIRHLDRWGWPGRAPVTLDQLGTAPALGASRHGGWVALIDAEQTDELTVITPGSDDPIRRIPLDPIHRRATTFLAVDRSDHIVLVTPDPDRPQLVRLESLTADGFAEQRADIELPRHFGPLASLTAGADIVVAGRAGLARLEPCRDATRVEEATFTTPALVSPPAFQGGWNRAEIEVELPEGSAVEVTWATTSEVHVVGATTAFDPLTGSLSSLVYELDGLLPWRASTARYEGGVAPPGTTERLAVLIDDPGSTFLWVRVRLIARADRLRPALVGLQVGYPDTSYLDELPALYREDPDGVADLRPVLAPFEVLFDGLDDELSALPSRIDPATADPTWAGFLLEWLGFPPLADLAADRRQALLLRAADLLARRGTRQALQDVLDIVTGGRASVTDDADGPDLWFLPAAGAGGSAPGAGTGGSAPGAGTGPRLGFDTRIGAQQPAPGRAGALTLGRSTLGRGCTDPLLMLTHSSQLVTVRLDVDPSELERLQPIVERLLALFVPAQCRVRLTGSGGDGRLMTRLLDVDLRLGPDDTDTTDPVAAATPDGLLPSDAYWQLGATARPGRWQLPTRPGRPALLDRSVTAPHQRLN